MKSDAAALLKSVRELPPFPAVAMRVIALVNDNNVRMNQLAQVLGTDQALTAKLLRICNSAAIGYGHEVATVERAVVVLGLNQVRQLAFVTSVTSTFGRPTRIDDGFDVDRFWQHNLAVALACEALAGKAGTGVTPAEAFAAGVMHDIGRLVLRQVRPTEFAAALRTTEREGLSLGDAELLHTGFRHDDVGGAFGELWRFPKAMVRAIAGHHQPVASLDDLLGIVATCDLLADRHERAASSVEVVALPAALERAESLCGGWDAIEARATAMREAVAGSASPRTVGQVA